MCGVLGLAGRIEPGRFDALLNQLQHRGPDDSGVWRTPDLTMGHRRLSIIGLAAEGRQPLLSVSGESVLVFNGEIYNYLELADELQADGVACDRRFDTHVLLQALEHWGLGVLPRLNGMFALAWYRLGEDSVVLARDRWGKKPIYWGRIEDDDGRAGLLWSSELRTFAAHGGRLRTDPLGVARYLVYDGAPATRTVFRDVYKVPAATWTRVGLDGTQRAISRYWRVDWSDGGSVQEAAASDGLRRRLRRSLELRLRTDVPIGLFLSGGLDSSLLAAVWRELNPDQEIRTFTMGFEEPSYDERSSARVTAEWIGSRHNEYVLSGSELEATVGDVLDALPEPFADPSVVPTSILCRFARQEVTVAVGGDGADELQAGYDPFRAWKVADRLRRLMPSAILDSSLSLLERLCPASDDNLSLQFKIHHFRNGLTRPAEERVQGWMSSLRFEDLSGVLHPDLVAELDLEEVLEPSRRAYSRPEVDDPVKRQMSTWLETYLECCILSKVDTASMMHSLEVRAPFLDPDVAQFFVSLPTHLIFDGGRGKRLMRSLAQEILPEQIVRKKKKGFGVPLSKWYRTVLADRLEQAVAETERGTTWFHGPAVRNMLTEHRRGVRDHRKALWVILAADSFLRATG